MQRKVFLYFLLERRAFLGVSSILRYVGSGSWILSDSVGWVSRGPASYMSIVWGRGVIGLAHVYAVLYGYMSLHVDL